MNSDSPIKTERRGGARPNSGRPRVNTIVVSMRISPDFAAKIRLIAKQQHMTIGEVVEQNLRI